MGIELWLQVPEHDCDAIHEHDTVAAGKEDDDESETERAVFIPGYIDTRHGS